MREWGETESQGRGKAGPGGGEWRLEAGAREERIWGVELTLTPGRSGGDQGGGHQAQLVL